ncbi:hypothetical protein [Prauserella flavalba]|uniref:Uncharacterized protein n=1 Tax=Prauserella flavalba TaxID=1477506 RepID=A0A318LQ06_9PSEU|nr:hypothetical protein [Prauserella flavalba]PXY29725.1 hypothetical protein BA062_21370 [Prauserella flavalba]
MTTMPERTAAPGRVCVTGRRRRRILLGGGRSVRVLASYPVCREIGLHSLASAIEFECARCHASCEATLVGVLHRLLVCPSCYAALGARRRPRRERIEGFRPCRATPAGVKLYAFAR